MIPLRMILSVILFVVSGFAAQSSTIVFGQVASLHTNTCQSFICASGLTFQPHSFWSPIEPVLQSVSKMVTGKSAVLAFKFGSPFTLPGGSTGFAECAKSRAKHCNSLGGFVFTHHIPQSPPDMLVAVPLPASGLTLGLSFFVLAMMSLTRSKRSAKRAKLGVNMMLTKELV
jgi:hypothetical protein